MATPEGKVKDAVKKLLKTYNLWYFMPATFGMGTSGIPDIVGILPDGVLIGIETKAGKNKPTELQTRQLAAINAAGGVGIWVNETTLYLLEEAIHAHCPVT